MARGGKRRNALPRVWRQVVDNVGPNVHYTQMPEGVPPGGRPVGRLGVVFQHFPYDVGSVVSSMNFRRGGVFFCDSTLFISHTDPRIWDAMLEGSRLTLIPHIVRELRWWLSDVNDINTEIRERVKSHLDGQDNTGIRQIGRLPTAEYDRACLYYINLLGIRKHMNAIAESRLRERLGRSPTAQEVSNECQQGGTARAQLVAKQGATGKVKDHLYHDEVLVAVALLFAISTGVETTLLTSDEAVLDQFYKAACLLTWHYNAMHLADRYVDDRFALSVAEAANPDAECFADEMVRLVRKKSSVPLELLPAHGTPVHAHCMLLQQEITRVTFSAEVEMRRLLNVKSQTGGLNTARCDGQNCHVFLSQRARLAHGDVAIIARDVSAHVGVGTIRLAALDLELALTCNERADQIIDVDPNFLILPSS